MARRRHVRAAWIGALLAITAVAALACTAALGFWSGSESLGSGPGTTGADTVLAGAAPTARQGAGSSVVVTWGSSSLSNGTPVDGYVVNRYDQDSPAAPTITSGCTGTITATTCTEASTPAGNWQYTVTPVFAAHWRGAESLKSGAVNTGPGTLTLARTLFGGTVAPLPATVAGTVTGFAPDEAVTYLLDDTTPLVGSPSHVAHNGTATISLTIPAGTGDGPHTVSVRGAAIVGSAGIIVDTTPPTIATVVTPTPNAAGWNNTSPVEVSGTVDDGNGSGVAFAKYTDDGSDPKTSPTARFATGPVEVTTTTTLKYYLADLAGNESPVLTDQVKIDTSQPFFTLEFTDIHGGAYVRPASPEGVPGTAYYRGAAAGSLRFQITPVPLGGSPAVSAGFTALPPDAIGFSFDSSSVTTPVGGPFVSNPLTWVAGSTSTPAGTISVTNVAGSTFGDSGPLYNDSTPPTGGSVDATGLVGTGSRYSTSLDLSLDLAPGTDADSGLAGQNGAGPSDVPAQLMRASAPLASGDGVADGSCGAYGAYAQVGGADPASPFADHVPVGDRCYRYRYLVSDHVGNIATYTSPDIKVAANPPPSLTPTAATLTPNTGTAAQFVSGSTLYYNPAQSGSFGVGTSATSPAGVAQVDFPAITGFTGGGVVTAPATGTTFRSQYAWSANASSPSPGSEPIAATDNAGQTATNPTAFALVKDAVPPSGGSADAIGLGGTGDRYSTSTSLSIALAPGTDAGSGLAATGRTLLRASASLSSDGAANGSCGTFGGYVQVGGNDPASPKTDVVPIDRACYRYRYVVPDNVGNQATYTSPDIKVDAAAPPAPTLTFSNLSNASATATTVFYRPAAASGGFTVTAASADTTSGIAGFAFPTLPTGWTDSSAGAAARNYSWSAPNPTPPVGGQAVTATNNAGGASTSTFAVAVSSDSTPPSGGTVSYTNGYSTNAAVNVSFTKGTDSGSGLAANSGLLQRSSAPLSNASCGTFGAFTTVATNPTSAYSDPVTTACYQYRYLISDNVGNQATYTSAGIVKVDQVPPTNTISITNVNGGAYSAFAGATLYYKGDAAGSFKYVDAVGDAESGPASADFPDIATTGWTHNAETVSTPLGGPYVSSTFSWTANAANPPLKSIVGRDAAGKIWSAAISFTSDIVPPNLGAISYTNGLLTTASVPVTLNIGIDGAAGSGVDPATTVIKRDEAPLTPATETCGAFAGTYATTVTLVGGADTSVSTGHCYQYHYIVSDHVGNATTYTSASVAKVDTSGPRVTAIASQQSGGGAGDGRLVSGDKLVLTFNQSLAPAGVPATFAGATEASGAALTNTKLAIPGITQGPLDTGTPGYLALPLTTATFGGTVALVNGGTATTVTLTVTSVTGGATVAGSGALAFLPAATITDGSGNAAATTFTTVSGFKLF